MNGQLIKNKLVLIEDGQVLQRKYDDECSNKAATARQVHTQRQDTEDLRNQYEEELESKNTTQKNLSNSSYELTRIKTKYDQGESNTCIALLSGNMP